MPRKKPALNFDKYAIALRKNVVSIKTANNCEVTFAGSNVIFKK